MFLIFKNLCKNFGELVLYRCLKILVALTVLILKKMFALESLDFFKNNYSMPHVIFLSFPTAFYYMLRV